MRDQSSSRTVQSSRLQAWGAKVQSMRCEVEVVGFVPRVSCKVTARILCEWLCICFSLACLWQVIAATVFVHDLPSLRATLLVFVCVCFPRVSQKLLGNIL